MNCNLPKITYSAIRILLLVKLFEAIYPQKDVAVTKAASVQFEAELSTCEEESWVNLIPLKQVRNTTFVVAYQSAIARKLMRAASSNTVDLADQIATQFRSLYLKSQAGNLQIAEFLLREFTVKATNQGWLEFGLSDQGLAAWLQFLMQNPLSVCSENLTPTLSNTNQDSLFTCQHTHARCCSLLRMGQDTGFIQLGGEPCDWVLLSPYTIPWLTLEGRFLLNQPLRELIFQIVATVDDLYNPSLFKDRQAYLKRSIALSQAFQQFYSACRIFAEPLEISQSRLGFVFVTQKALRALLQQGIGIAAPAEL